ncbi:hypothetical protein KQX54_020086 [Cotesia glomerata]|uniref:FLYWCH-type domain-containing protein n=1 Tax=Cotesia glomerata TaxID=32391 RepID=A0AAV7ITM0_COTGL|nr:hypothetical protein KQX54_020086 [Cotesia glomerata]
MSRNCNFIKFESHICDGYAYHLNKNSKNKYLQCDRRRTNQCGGRAIFSEDGNTVEKKIHNHPRDYTLHDISIFREELKRAIKSELNDAGDIYDRLARLHQFSIISLRLAKRIKTLSSIKEIVCGIE